MSKSRFNYSTDSWWYAHPEPPVRFADEVQRMLKLSTRLDAWKAFLTERTLQKFDQLKGCFYWLDGPLSEMKMDFVCPPEELRTVIQSLLLTPQPVEFVRRDLYDSRAWCEFPLSAFVPITGIRKELTKEWHNAWRHAEDMPVVHFGVFNQPWTVTPDCFHVIRRQQDYKSHAVLVFKHPQNDPHFGKDGRWCAEMEWPKDDSGKPLPKAEVMRQLYAKMEVEAAKHYVTVAALSVARRLRGEPPLELPTAVPHTRE